MSSIAVQTSANPSNSVPAAISVANVSILIPVYKNDGGLDELVRRIGESMANSAYANSFELILVDDCSPDNSWEVIQRLAKAHAFVQGATLSRNFGQHNAIMAGLNLVSGQYIILMDDDLQHPPEAIPSMLDKLAAGADVCYTSYANRQHAAWKIAGSKFNDLMASWLLSKPKGLYLSSFKALKRGVVDQIRSHEGPFAYLDGLILDITRRIATVEIQHGTRAYGEGNYSFKKSISLWLRMVTGTSIVPLRMVTLMGALIALLGFFGAVFIVISNFLYPAESKGWASIIVTILLVSGFQTLFIGVLGEYLGRIHLRLNNKPQYLFRYTTKSDTEFPKL
jgi:undecaprenyl-phosphate 4-deoxy-4-formamido-L-arabinose transferase